MELKVVLADHAQLVCDGVNMGEVAWLAVANKLLELMAKMMAEVGPTPTSRSRVHAQPATSMPISWEFGRSKFDSAPHGHEAPNEFFD